MLSESYSPLIGGTERHVQTLSHELVKRGHQVAVVTLQTGAAPDFEDEEGVHVYRLTGWSRVLTQFYQNQSRQYHPPIPDPGVIAGLRKVIELEHPEIVHARRWMLYSFVSLKSWSGAKLVVTLHDYNLCCPTTGYLHNGQVCTGPAYRKCLQCAGQEYGKGKGMLVTNGLMLSSHLHKYVDKYIAVSAAVRDASIHATGHPAKPIEVVPTFIPDTVVDEALSIERPDFLPPTDDYILFVGRQDSHKGLDVLLDAYAGLSPTVPLVLLIAGSDDSSRQLPAGAIAIRNAPHAQVMAAWLHCAIGVVPSIWPEPFGQVAVEAMMCGKPIIASAIGGLRDVVVDGESGLLVPPGNASALRDALQDLLLHPDKRSQMGLVGEKRAHLFTVGTVANRIEEIYTDLLTS
jgi:glycosyltransferase involved in cell wall biosynthesis